MYCRTPFWCINIKLLLENIDTTISQTSPPKFVFLGVWLRDLFEIIIITPLDQENFDVFRYKSWQMNLLILIMSLKLLSWSNDGNSFYEIFQSNHFIALCIKWLLIALLYCPKADGRPPEKSCSVQRRSIDQIQKAWIL